MDEKIRTELRRDAAAAVGLLVLALGYGLKARQIPGSSLIGKGIGAGAVPTALALALGGFSLILLVRALRGLRRLGGGAGVAPGVRSDAMRRHLRALGMLLIGIAFVSVLDTLGYPLAIGLLLGATAWYNGQRQLKSLLLFVIGGAIAYDLMFVQLLEIDLPSGIWPALFGRFFGGN